MAMDQTGSRPASKLPRVTVWLQNLEHSTAGTGTYNTQFVRTLAVAISKGAI
ncbi:hypothetical protein SDJN02_06323, partial [Cucurbita argyrosperma subsp. argyrosperma]